MIKTEIQVRFSDIDMLGHVNNVVLQSYYDTGKVDYFVRVMGLDPHWTREAFIVVNTNTNYYEEVRVGSKFYLTTKILKVGTKSLTFEQEIVDSDSQFVKSRSESILVGFDLQTRQSIAVRDELRKLILEHENN